MSHKTYCKRMWLNKGTSASTGSVVAFHGKTTYGNRKQEIVTFLEIADCHSKVCIHQIKKDTRSSFIQKLRLLVNTINDFANFLEDEK